jgi:hypothetical protein
MTSLRHRMTTCSGGASPLGPNNVPARPSNLSRPTTGAPPPLVMPRARPADAAPGDPRQQTFTPVRRQRGRATEASLPTRRHADATPLWERGISWRVTRALLGRQRPRTTLPASSPPRLSRAGAPGHPAVFRPGTGARSPRHPRAGGPGSERAPCPSSPGLPPRRLGPAPTSPRKRVSSGPRWSKIPEEAVPPFRSPALVCRLRATNTLLRSASQRYVFR